jgi:hypothetical protein
MFGWCRHLLFATLLGNRKHFMVAVEWAMHTRMQHSNTKESCSSITRSAISNLVGCRCYTTPSSRTPAAHRTPGLKNTRHYSTPSSSSVTAASPTYGCSPHRRIGLLGHYSISETGAARHCHLACLRRFAAACTLNTGTCPPHQYLISVTPTGKLENSSLSEGMVRCNAS